MCRFYMMIGKVVRTEIVVDVGSTKKGRAAPFVQNLITGQLGILQHIHHDEPGSPERALAHCKHRLRKRFKAPRPLLQSPLR